MRIERTVASPVSVAELAGISGTLRVDVPGDSLGTIFVDRGRVWADETASRADAVAVVDVQGDFERILRGEFDLVVAEVKGRIELRGNSELATRIIIALNVAKPFAMRRDDE